MSPPQPVHTDVVPDPVSAKAMGAFYTDALVADFLVWWALRRPRDTALDPSFGGGVFLKAACRRLEALGGAPARQVFGVELDPRVHGEVSQQLEALWAAPQAHLERADFFHLPPGPRVRAVVGNPPFIRYQRFSGPVRHRALERAACQGVVLSELASSWAPFLVHSAAMLEPGGRLAMVIPVELCHAGYAVPVLEFLARAFGTVTFITFQARLFPALGEDTLLLLADDRGALFSGFHRLDLPAAGALEPLLRGDSRVLPGLETLDAAALAAGRERLIEYAIPGQARALYRDLARGDGVRRLGVIADVGVGYVTGANDFFHLTPAEAARWKIPARYLRPAIRRGRALSGLALTRQDWQRALETGDAGYLLLVEALEVRHPGVREYLEQGRRLGIPAGFKCRRRSPWYRVPHVYRPDAFLTYMSGETPRLVANAADVVAPNTLHVVRLHAGTGAGPGASRESLLRLAACWYTSLTLLSAELEGHALGGGMLKLEPGEAAKVLIALPPDASGLEPHIQRIDALLRAGELAAAQTLADQVILIDGLGLSPADCRALRDAMTLLRERRCAPARRSRRRHPAATGDTAS